VGGAWATFVAIFVFFVGGTYAGNAVVWARALTWLGAASVLLAWLAVALRRPALRPTGPLPIAIVGAAAVFVASALGSARPRLSFEPTLIGLATALLFLALLGLLRLPGARRRAGSLIIVLAAAVAVGYLVQVAVEWANWWLLVGRLTQPPLRPNWAGLTFGSPNLVATALLLLGPLATVLLARRVGRLAAAGLAVTMVVAVLLTGSRGGYIGVGAALVAGLGLVALRSAQADGVGDEARRPPRALLRFPGPWWRVAPVGGAAIVIAAVAAGPALLARFTAGGLDDRLGFWRTAMAMFLDHPWTGGGPGTWAQLRYAYLGPDDPTYAVPHTHNLYLQIPAELGLVGAICLGLTAAIFLRVWWRAWLAGQGQGRDDPHVAPVVEAGPTSAEVAAVLVGLAGLGGQSLVDNLVNLPGISLAVALLVAWVGAGDGGVGSWTQVTRLGRAVADGRVATVGAAALAIAILAGSPMLVRAELAAVEAEAGNAAADAGDWAAALARYEAALALDPDHSLYQLERGVALAHLGRLVEAREAYARAVPVDLLPENTIALATLHWQVGETAAALASAEDAFRRGARSALVALNAGRIFEATGALGRAAEAYATALADDPALGRSSYWQLSERRVRLTDLVFRARDVVLVREPTDHERAALVLAYAGLVREAIGETDAIADPAARAFTRLVVTAIGGDPAAVDEIRAEALRDPLDFPAVGWTARFAAVAGDPAAVRYRTWAAIIRNDAADSLVFERSLVPAPEWQRVFGIVANYPFVIYQRPPPRDFLPPGVLVIGARLGG